MIVSNARVGPEIELANQIAVGINKHKRHALVLKYTALTLIRQSTPRNLDCNGTVTTDMLKITIHVPIHAH